MAYANVNVFRLTTCTLVNSILCSVRLYINVYLILILMVGISLFKHNKKRIFILHVPNVVILQIKQYTICHFHASTNQRGHLRVMM